MARPSNTPNTEPGEPIHDGMQPHVLHGREDHLAPPPAPLPYEQFLNWADEDTFAEWVDGTVVMASPANTRHQQIKGFLMEVLATFVRMRDLGIVLDAPFQMKLARSGREPDVLYIATQHLGRLKETYLDGPADLAIEIVSPDSIECDRRDKLAEYQEAGIPEYWLIDPLMDQAAFYTAGTRRHLPPLAAARQPAQRLARMAPW